MMPIVVTGLILVILVGMGLNEPTRAEFVQSLVALGVILAAYGVRKSRTRKVGSFATASNNAHSSSKKA